MTSGANDEQPLLLFAGSRNTHQPLGIGHLGSEILRLLQVKIDLRGFLSDGRHLIGISHFVTYGSDVELIFSLG